MKLFKSQDEGASAVIVAASMVLLIAMAAVAIDLGAGFNERRQDQIAADAGALAGALEAINGDQALTEEAATYVASNLGTTVANMDASWVSCIDPDSDRNTQPGDNFVSTSLANAASAWLSATPTNPDNWCMSFDPVKQLFRVKIPDQFTETTFARVIGTTSLATGASAVSEIVTAAPGQILPFALDSGPQGGEHVCLSSGPNGLAIDPCDGSTTGNFGTLKGRQFGNPQLGTDENCNSSPVGQTLAQNIALGIDHIIVTDPDNDPANEVRDVCKNPLVDTLNTDTGFPNNGAETGLVGPVPSTSYLPNPTPRLMKGFAPGATVTSTPLEIFNGHEVDNTPLWDYLLTSGVSYDDIDAPASCDPGPMSSWTDMEACLADYASGGYSTVIFSEDLLNNLSRFSYIPQFWENSLGNGNSWNHIRRFRAVYINITVWKDGGNFGAHAPEEGCIEAACGTSGWSMTQVTAFTFPDAALPALLRGDPIPPSPGLNPISEVLLVR